MSRLFTGDIASGIELMGLPMPTLIQTTFKLLRVGIMTVRMFWELIPNGFLCKKANFLFILYNMFSFRAIEKVGGENDKKKNKKKKKKNKKKKKQSVLKNETTYYFGITFT